MTKILGFLAGLIGVKLVKIGLYIFYFVFLSTFVYFMFDSLVTFYNLVHDFIDYPSTFSSDVDLSRFFGLLDCIGFTDALLSSFPALSASLVFLFLRLLYSVTYKSFKSYLSFLD